MQKMSLQEKQQINAGFFGLLFRFASSFMKSMIISTCVDLGLNILGGTMNMYAATKMVTEPEPEPTPPAEPPKPKIPFVDATPLKTIFKMF